MAINKNVQIIIPQIVPCGKCTACCQGDLIFLHPEMGDDISQYKTMFFRGRFVLQHKPNKDCFYLDRQKGCTIHERRPAICQELDCRIFLKMPKSRVENLLSKGFITKKIIKAARILNKKERNK